MILSIISILIIFGIFIYKPIKGLIVLIVWLPTLRLLSINSTDVVVWDVILFSFYTLLAYYKTAISKLKSFPLLIAFLLCILSKAITFIYWNDGHYLNFAANLSDYFLVFLFWIFYKPRKGYFVFFIKNLVLYLLILSSIGLYESLILGTYNPFIEYLMANKELSATLSYESNYRFGFWRAQSLTVWSDPLCIICGIGWVFLIYSYLHKYLKSNLAICLLFVVLPITMFITGGRAAMMGTFIMLLSCVGKINRRTLFRLVPLIVVLLIVFNIGDYGQQLIDSFSGKFENQSDGGSSLEMRTMQLNAALMYLNQSPIIGNGLGFSAIAQERTAALMGVESIIFSTLINTGILGLISLAVLIISSLVWVVRVRAYHLIFFLIGFYTAKILTLLFSIHETYILLFLIPIVQEFYSSNMVSSIFSQAKIKKQ